jgi:hypothetical protein
MTILATRLSAVPTSSAEYIAILEVGRQPDGGLQGELIAAAYRVSRSAPVLLVLDRVSRAEVDRALDEVVTSSELNRPGVVYADAADDALVMAAATRAHWVFARSSRFRAKLDARGLPYHDLTLQSDPSALIAWSDHQGRDVRADTPPVSLRTRF